MAEQINEMSGNKKTSWYANNPDATVFAISTADELAGLAGIVNGDWIGEPKRDDFSGKIIKLTADIDLSAYDNWAPIGSSNGSDRHNEFSGTFDGGGHVIKNLTIDRPDADFQGLFGWIDGDYTGNDGRVKNLGLVNVNIRGHGYVGSFAGRIDMKSSVIGCYSTGTVSGAHNVGGLVGEAQNKSSVINSRSASAVSGKNQVGGVVGDIGSGCLLNCCSAGEVSGRNNVGGIAGNVGDRGGVINCAAMNPGVKGAGEKAGRVVGSIWNYYDEEEEKDPNYNENTFLNNIANAQMTNNAGNTEWHRKGAENFDGRDVAANDINTDNTNNGLFPNDLETNPNHARALYSRGVAYILIDEHDKAIADLTAVLKINPANASALFHRGEAYHLKRNENDKAIADLTAALKIRLDSAETFSRNDDYIISLLCHACHNAGDYDKAIADCSAVLKIHPNHARALYCRGDAHYKKSELDKAVEDFEAVLRIWPDHWSANKALEEIRGKTEKRNPKKDSR